MEDTSTIIRPVSYTHLDVYKRQSQVCMMLYEQNVLPFDEEQYNRLSAGAVSAYDFIRSKITSLEITPGQLGVEPSTGSFVMTEVATGKTLALVS